MSGAALELVWEASGLPDYRMPSGLVDLYGGELGFESPRLIANFVATIDGVVAIPSIPLSNRLIAASSSADRFVMGLLRACCDAVVIGSATLAASPNSLWTASRAFPDAADAFAELRRRLGRPPDPRLVVLSARGLLDPTHPALAAGALVLTTDRGAARLEGALPEASSYLSLGSADTLAPERIVAAMREGGHDLILSEGGPHAIGPFFAAGLVDELFLTVSPLLLGRSLVDPRLSLVEGTDLLGVGSAAAQVLGIRRAGEHLFLRYGLGAQ